MSSEELGLSSSQNGLNNAAQLVFHQDESLRFGAPIQRRVGDSGPKTRELTGFIDDRYFPAPHNPDFRRSLYAETTNRDPPPEPRNWDPNGTAAVRSEGSDDDDDDDDEDEEDDDVEGEDDDDDGDVGGLFGVGNRSKGSGGNNVSNGEVRMGNGNVKHQLHPSSFGGTLILGSSREVLEKDHSVSVGQQPLNNNTRASPSCNNHDQLPGRLGSYQNAIVVAESTGRDMYYSHYLQGSEGGGAGQKDLIAENACDFSGRKDAVCLSEAGDSLRAILSDPVTGALMDDAMILPCGHSFGSGGVQQVLRMKTCFTCSQSISEDSVSPNLSLQAAVQAFCREEELHFYRSSKRKRERFDQEKGGYGDLGLRDLPPRGRGVQFPFAVTDRVIIKGNKRTPQRFVGREAVVTTQCLNGWYVVKTLDNAESVKLQYRSLARVSDDPSSKALPCKMAPNWL